MEPDALLDRLRDLAVATNARSRRAGPGSPGVEEALRGDALFLHQLATALEGELGGSGGPTIRRLASEVRP